MLDGWEWLEGIIICEMVQLGTWIGKQLWKAIKQAVREGLL